MKSIASIIHIQQYREWRHTGIAFEFGDAKYDAPNRSSASYAVGMMKAGRDRGMRKEVKGYWLDILVGPYIALGVECYRNGDSGIEALFRILNKGTGTEQHRHHAVEISMYNMLRFMWQLQASTDLCILATTGEICDPIVAYQLSQITF